MTVILEPGGPRSARLIEQAYSEEGLECPQIDERMSPGVLLFPRSYIEAVEAMPAERLHDYCFVGSVYRPELVAQRSWVLDFAAERFTDRSYLVVTDQGAAHTRFGSFDRTGLDTDVFVPKDVPEAERTRFHHHYFRVLRSSDFTLCPAGDKPWSMRFFEAIMCRSIPVVADREHTGRNELERAIGYHVALRDDVHVYDPQLAEENHRLFIEHHTLLTPSDRERAGGA